MKAHSDLTTLILARDAADQRLARAHEILRHAHREFAAAKRAQLAAVRKLADAREAALGASA